MSARRALHLWRPKSAPPKAVIIALVFAVGVLVSFGAGFIIGKIQPQPSFEPPVAVSSSRLDAGEVPHNTASARLPPLRGREPVRAKPKVGGTAPSGTSEGQSDGGSNGGSGVVSTPGIGDAKTAPQSAPTETVPEPKPTETVPGSTKGKASK